MKPASWNECTQFNNALRVTPDEPKARSLITTSNARLTFLQNAQHTLETLNFIFEGYYSFLLEHLHAFLILKGYKIDNHLCIGYYIRDVLKKDDLYRLFDDCRYKRNSLAYYGKQMPEPIANQAIKNCQQLITHLSP